MRNNLVHHVGRLYPSAIAIWGDGSDGQVCRIEHNTLHDTPYTAIACGGDDHRIEHNHIFRAMQELHDGAGIYISSCNALWSAVTSSTTLSIREATGPRRIIWTSKRKTVWW